MAYEERVIVIDDDPGVRGSLESLFKTVQLPHVTYSSVDEFEAEYQDDLSGCLLLDVRLPGKSGVALHQDLVKRGTALSVILVSGHADVPIAVQAMKDGALDVLEKPYRTQELLDRVHEALAQSRQRLRERKEKEAAEERFRQLTAREKEVVQLVLEGKRNREIAAEAGVTSQAIDARRARAMQKLGVENIPALVAFMLRLSSTESFGRDLPRGSSRIA